MEECSKFGMPLPEKIRNAPTLHMGSELYYAGFLDLTSCRSLGHVVGPVSYLTMLDYCNAHAILGEQRDDFLWIVPRLDQKYLNWLAKKAEK